MRTLETKLKLVCLRMHFSSGATSPAQAARVALSVPYNVSDITSILSQHCAFSVSLVQHPGNLPAPARFAYMQEQFISHSYGAWEILKNVLADLMCSEGPFPTLWQWLPSPHLVPSLGSPLQGHHTWGYDVIACH